jgi:Domain of unknown function (DUF4291)
MFERRSFTLFIPIQERPHTLFEMSGKDDAEGDLNPEDPEDPETPPEPMKSIEFLDSQGSAKEWRVESYETQSKRRWPGRGQHILAQFDDDSIVVYQAYRREIAEYAVEHQRFAGCKFFGESRSTFSLIRVISAPPPQHISHAFSSSS